MRRGFMLVTVFGSLIATAALAQQPAPATVWPDPPQARPPAPAQKPAARKPRQKPAAAQAAPDPRLENQPGPNAAAARPAKGAKSSPALNIRCDGPFARDSNHDKLAKAYGARNVTVQGGSTVLFPNDPKRRLEVVWHDAAGRSRPATITIEGRSTWQARGFRIGEPMAKVEKINGKPFRLSGFAEDSGGAARDWQGGALDQLSGGCLLGMRFTPDAKAPADARSKVAVAELASDGSDVRAVKPTIAELIVGYPE